MYLGISFPRTPAHDKLVYLLFPEHNVHILSTFLIQLKPFPKCLPTCLLPFWKIWLKCFLTNRFAHIHTCVEHPLPCTPLASIFWATIWLLLNASIHCYTAYIYSLSPRSSIRSTVILSPETRTKKYSSTVADNNVAVMIMGLYRKQRLGWTLLGNY